MYICLQCLTSNRTELTITFAVCIASGLPIRTSCLGCPGGKSWLTIILQLLFACISRIMAPVGTRTYNNEICQNYIFLINDDKDAGIFGWCMVLYNYLWFQLEFRLYRQGFPSFRWSCCHHWHQSGQSQTAGQNHDYCIQWNWICWLDVALSHSVVANWCVNMLAFTVWMKMLIFAKEV